MQTRESDPLGRGWLALYILRGHVARWVSKPGTVIGTWTRWRGKKAECNSVDWRPPLTDLLCRERGAMQHLI